MDRSVTFSKAVEGYKLDFYARHLSPQTFADYFNTFKKFALFLEVDPPIAEITKKEIKEFLASQNGLANKTLLNYHTGLSALWSWATQDGLAKEHIVHRVERPKPEKREIKPYS